METIELNCQPIIVNCVWPEELLVTAEARAMLDGLRKAVDVAVQQELGRIERRILGLDIQLTEELQADVVLQGNYASEQYAREFGHE